MSWWRVALLGAVVATAGAGYRPRPGVPAWSYRRRVDGIEVRDRAGATIPQPFIGGFNNPRPQLVDLGGGRLDLFVQEFPGQLMYFEHVGDRFVWRTDAYQDLDIGQWFRFADLDGDGLPDLLAEQPFGYIRVFRNAGTAAAPRFVPAVDSLRDVDGAPIYADPQNILNVVDIDCNQRLDLFIGRLTGTIDHYEADGLDAQHFPRFRLIDDRWQGIQILGPTPGVLNGLMPDRGGTSRHGANTMAFGDIDGDGDLDLFWGDFFEPGLLLIPNDGGCATPALHAVPKRFPAGSAVITSGYNAPTVGDVDGDGRADVVMGVVGGAYQPNHTTIANLYLIEQRAPGVFTTVTSQLIPMIDVGSESAPALADLDGDGDLDLLIGNRIDPANDSTGTITWFENIGSRTAPVFADRGPLPITGQYNYAPAVADLDGDGRPDLILGTWTDHVEWYRNSGTAAHPAWTLADSALVVLARGSNTVPAAGDIDGDGLVDLVVGSASGHLTFYRNAGSRTAPRFVVVPTALDTIKFGRRAAPALADMDGDGRLDLLIGNEDGAITLWRNSGPAGSFLFTRDTTFTLTSAPDATPVVGDLRGRGARDILVGTEGGGLRWYEDATVRR